MTPADGGAAGREDLARHQRAGAHLFKKAREDGWKDDGEGAYEYMIRRAYEAGARRAASSGFAIVPIKATALMEQAGSSYIFEDGINHEARCEAAANVWSAMLTARQERDQ